jgi:hypothetical protein
MARARARAKHQLRDEERPWGECCDLAVCVKTYPLTCSCFDRVERCSDACKECVETEDSRHVCVDRYRGDPGPRCHDEDGRSGGKSYIYITCVRVHACMLINTVRVLYAYLPGT